MIADPQMQIEHAQMTRTIAVAVEVLRRDEYVTYAERESLAEQLEKAAAGQL